VTGIIKKKKTSNGSRISTDHVYYIHVYYIDVYYIDVYYIDVFEMVELEGTFTGGSVCSRGSSVCRLPHSHVSVYGETRCL